MATQPVGKVIHAKLIATSAVTDIVGAGGVYPQGAVPTDTPAPFVEYRITGNRAHKDLAGNVIDYVAQAVVTVTAASYEQCQTLMAAVVTALDAMSGSIASITVTAAEVGDVSDEPNGPIDQDDAQVYESVIPVQFAYT